jgi:hypothetical protein
LHKTGFRLQYLKQFWTILKTKVFQQHPFCYSTLRWIIRLTTSDIYLYLFRGKNWEKHLPLPPTGFRLQQLNKFWTILRTYVFQQYHFHYPTLQLIIRIARSDIYTDKKTCYNILLFCFLHKTGFRLQNLNQFKTISRT